MFDCQQLGRAVTSDPSRRCRAALRYQDCNPLESAIAEDNVAASGSDVAVCVWCDGLDPPFARSAGESEHTIGGVVRLALEIHLRHEAVDFASNPKNECAVRMPPVPS
jgi:hypothetical protein